VRWPGVVRPGSICRTPVISVDFYPTLLEIAGTERPAGQVLDGESLIPLLRQRGQFKDRALYWHYPHYHHSTPAGAIREGDWKLIEFFENGLSQLYDLRDDLGEQTDLSAVFPRKALELQIKLARWRRSVGAAMPQANPDFDPTRRKEWGAHPDR
jgi:arylsulfatase A